MRNTCCVQERALKEFNNKTHFLLLALAWRMEKQSLCGEFASEVHLDLPSPIPIKLPRKARDVLRIDLRQELAACLLTEMAADIVSYLLNHGLLKVKKRLCVVPCLRLDRIKALGEYLKMRGLAELRNGIGKLAQCTDRSSGEIDTAVLVTMAF